MPSGFVLSEFKLFFYIAAEIRDFYAFLLHRISVTNGYATVCFGIEIVCYAERRSDLVLPAVSLADRTRFIKIGGEVFCKFVVNLNSLVAEFL